MSVPTSQAAFRTVVEGLDRTTESGQDTFAALVKLAPAFAQVYGTAEQVLSDTISSITEQLRAAEAERERIISAAVGQFDGLERELLALGGNVEAVRALDLEQIDPINRNLQKFVWALEDVSSAVDKYRQHMDELAGAGEGIAAYVALLRSGVSGKAGNVAGLYRNDLAQAQAGDIDASGRIVGSAQAYLEQIARTSSTRTQYDIAATRIAAELSALPATQTYAEQQLEELRNIVTAMDAFSLSFADALAAGFEGLDANLDGLLTYEELTNALSGIATDAEIVALIEAVDRNGDGQISALELVRQSVGELAGDRKSVV
jgi:hypothetical protein